MLLSEENKRYLKKLGNTKKDVEWIECALVMSGGAYRGGKGEP